MAAVVLALVLAFAGGCGGYGASVPDRDTQSDWAAGAPAEGLAVEQKVLEASNEEAPRAPGVAEIGERLIIRTGNLSMEVEDTRAAQATIETLVKRMAGEGAFVVSSEEHGGIEGDQPYITMSIRIPAARFDETMDRLAEMAVNVSNRTQSGQDVTEEYVDLEARLESLEAARQRLLSIMEEARSTKDLLEAEQQLTQREAEIESLKGRMQYLEQSARLSSIWIELQPYLLSQPVGDQWRPAETVRRAVDSLLEGLRGFANFAIFFSIAVLPWLAVMAAILAGIIWLVRWRSRIRRAKQAAEVPAAEGPASEGPAAE
ncbi:MAG: DUF4349 domain-containing protein [Anaerolineae bacterium]